MSRTHRGDKAPGYDFWSRRNKGCKNGGYGKIRKKKTKRSERQLNKLASKRAIEDMYDFDKQFPGE